MEAVNHYTVFGKERPALVLREIKGEHGNHFLVWYTCTSKREMEDAIEVTKITKPPKPKRAFLKPHADEFRIIPRTPTWCGDFIHRLDETVFAGFFERAQKIPFPWP
jgi:hypothetical protein